MIIFSDGFGQSDSELSEEAPQPFPHLTSGGRALVAKLAAFRDREDTIVWLLHWAPCFSPTR